MLKNRDFGVVIEGTIIYADRDPYCDNIWLYPKLKIVVVNGDKKNLQK